MADEFVLFPWEFYATILGGGISGAVGLLVAWYHNKQNEKQWEIRAIYVPIYNIVADIQTKPFLESIIPDLWREIDNYKKFKMDSKIVNLIDRYSVDCEPYGKFHITFENEFFRKEKEIEALVKPIFSKWSLLDDDNKVRLSKTYAVYLSGIIRTFRYIIYDPTIKDAESLFGRMLEYSIEKKDDHIIKWLKETRDNKQEFFKDLKNFGNGPYKFPLDLKFEDLLQERKISEERVNLLRNALENKIK